MKEKIQKLLNKCGDGFYAVKDRVIETTERISDNASPITKYVLIGAVCVLIILIIILIIMLIPKDSKFIPIERQVVLQDSLYLPEQPSLSDDYVLHREGVQHWDDDEINQWFTVPSDSMLQDLAESNKKIISNILEVAP